MVGHPNSHEVGWVGDSLTEYIWTGEFDFIMCHHRPLSCHSLGIDEVPVRLSHRAVDLCQGIDSSPEQPQRHAGVSWGERRTPGCRDAPDVVGGGELVHVYPPIHPQSTVWIWGHRRVMNDLFLHCGIEPTDIIQICDGYGDNLSITHLNTKMAALSQISTTSYVVGFPTWTERP